PGLGVVAAVVGATGTPGEDSMSQLGADATRTGAGQTSLGGSVEQAFCPLFVGVAGGPAHALARRGGTIHDERDAVRLAVVAAGGYIFDSGLALLGTLSYSGTGDATANGQSLERTGQRQLTLGAAGGVPVSRTWRLQGSLFSDLPIAGQNHPAGLGAAF